MDGTIRRTDEEDDGRTEREGSERRAEITGQSEDPNLIDDRGVEAQEPRKVNAPQ